MNTEDTITLTQNKILEFITNKGNCKILNIEDYKNNNTKLILECEKKHLHEISWANLSQGKWRAICSKNKKLTIEFAQNIAEERGGKLLSTEYKNSSTKLKWQCKNGHKFEMKINAINSRNNWCPYCSKWTSEEICRIYFQSIFNQSFIKMRPKWLTNSRGNLMELDGISSNMIDGYFLAFEHQGEQHFKKDLKITSKNFYFNLDLNQRKLDDERKKELCINNNVILIQIPQLFKMLKLNDLPVFIKENCKFINTNAFDFYKKIDINSLHINDNKKYYFEIKNIVESKGGKLLNDNIINSIIKNNIICSNKHEFKLSSNSIKSGNWCLECYLAENKNNKTKEILNKISNHANNNDLKFYIKESFKYLNSSTIINWVCKKCNKSRIASYSKLIYKPFKCICNESINE